MQATRKYVSPVLWTVYYEEYLFLYIIMFFYDRKLNKWLHMFL